MSLAHVPALAALAALAALPASLEPQEPAVPGPARGGPEVLLEALDGSLRRQPLEGPVTPGDLGSAVFLRLDGLQRPELPTPDPRRLAQLTLTGGDRLSGPVRGLDEERLEVELPGGGRVAVSVDHLLALRFPGRLARAGQDDGEVQAPEGGDRLYRLLPRGLDRVDGLLVGFSEEGVLFESRVGERNYPWKEVAALFVEPLEELGGGESEPAGGVPVVVDLVGGDRLTAEFLGLGPAGLILSGRLGSISLPLALVDEVLVDNGRYAFLSWLELADAGPQASPFDPPGAEPLGMVWPHRADRAVDGSPLRAGGRAWSRGLGVHAPSRLTWALGGDFASFRAQVAVDDQTLRGPRPGSVRFRVLVDGEPRFQSPVLRSGDPVLPIPTLDLAGAQELVLEVDDGGDGPVLDRANWLRPLLVRAAD